MYESGTSYYQPPYESMGMTAPYSAHVNYWTRVPMIYSRAQRKSIAKILADEHREYRARVHRVGIFRNKATKIYTVYTESAEVYRICLSIMEDHERIGIEAEDFLRATT